MATSDSPQTSALVASTVKTVAFTEDWDYVEVMNVDGAGGVPVYFRTDGTNPTVAGNGCNPVPGLAGAALEAAVTSDGGTVVKLIAAGTPVVSVRGMRRPGDPA